VCAGSTREEPLRPLPVALGTANRRSFLPGGKSPRARRTLRGTPICRVPPRASASHGRARVPAAERRVFNARHPKRIFHGKIAADGSPTCPRRPTRPRSGARLDWLPGSRFVGGNRREYRRRGGPDRGRWDRGWIYPRKPTQREAGPIAPVRRNCIGSRLADCGIGELASLVRAAPTDAALARRGPRTWPEGGARRSPWQATTGVRSAARAWRSSLPNRPCEACAAPRS
jgi:hypothetical protein